MELKMKLRSGLQMIKEIRNFPLYFGDYFRIIKDGNIVYSLRNGVRFKVRAKTTDREALNEVWIYNVYLPKGFEIGEEDLVVDIGGHVGLFSVLASKYAKSGKIYVFEPDSENYKLLQENIKMNNCRNIMTIKKAVSFENAKRDLFLSEDNQEAHSFLTKVRTQRR